MAMIMHNPSHPGELLREYIGSVQVNVAAKTCAWRDRLFPAF
jgi:plasmid maintenance system antidote protein VapI